MTEAEHWLLVRRAWLEWQRLVKEHQDYVIIEPPRQTSSEPASGAQSFATTSYQDQRTSANQQRACEDGLKIEGIALEVKI